MSDRLMELLKQRVVAEFEMKHHMDVSCCDSGVVYDSCGSKVCKLCHCYIIEYTSEYPSYQIKTDYTFDRFLKCFYEHKWRVNSHYICDMKVQHDFDLFYRAFQEITKDESCSFINNLAVYCILRNNNAQCLLNEFVKIKNHKSRKLEVCKRVLKMLNWNFNFYGYNKDMDKVFEMYEEFKTKVQAIAGENRVVSEFLKRLDEVRDMQDTCDPQTNTCIHKFKSGKLCGKPCKSEYCSKHNKKSKKIELEQ